MRSKNDFILFERTKPENSVIDETTGHAFVETNGTIVEMKYCRKCGKWHTIDDFHKNKHTVDGLSSWCKKCACNYNKEKYLIDSGKCSKPVIIKDEPKQVETDTVEIKPAVPSLDEIFGQYMETIVKPYKDRIAELETELGKARQEASKRADTDSLSTVEVEKLIMSRTDIQPRVLFNALKKINGAYTFKVYDANTGLTSEVKTEVA